MANTEMSRLSTSAEDYLKAIWSLSKDGLVSTNALAQALTLTSPSVSAMLAKLKDAGLVDYERYQGACLTDHGRRQACALLRRHRLLETFMIERLGYGWDEVHEEAEAIEHAITDRFTERLANLLGHPTHDPHGDPIPNADGTLPDTPNTPLAELEVGAALEVSRLLTQDDDVLRYLAELGITPGRRLQVRGGEPFGGLVQVIIDGRQQVLSKDLATLVRGAVTR
jgi:DtxR family Mn-dependent transcriptional regulator